MFAMVEVTKAEEINSAQEKKATVIIPHYNDHERLIRCLEALNYNCLDSVDVIVIDNGSNPNLSAVNERFPKFKFLTEQQKGAGPARNRGVAESSTPYLFFLDADCVPAKDWVEVALQCCKPNTLIGGHIDLYDETSGIERNASQAFEAVFAFNQKAYVENKGFAVTANLITSREVFLATGEFRNGVSEDLDWCRRAVNTGFALRYEDALRVMHPSRGDWEALKKKWIRLTSESWSLHSESILSRIKWVLSAGLMPVSVLVHLPKVFFSSKLHSSSERIKAAYMLTKLRLLRSVWMLKLVVLGHV